ncbi:MAG TPA: LacI family DNA-binding transcriptional regulator [Bryobacteraceae bacterium]|nr:LacI family DNA-binding transcriptional regulator [Bryobacteraceae bacterium]
MSLEEVAKRAKVSTATVSRVLNNVDVVKHSTRVRVMKAVQELKYHPNLHARSLAGGKNRTIGMIVSNMENPFFFDIFRAVEADAHAAGYEVVTANTNYRPEQLVTSIRLMIGRRVAGLLAVVSEMDTGLTQDLADSEIPVVFYDVGAPRPNITNIRVNYRKGIQKVVEYLYTLGHRRMAFIGHDTTLGPISDRRAAFEEAVRVLSAVEFRTVADADSLEGGRLAARDLLNSGFQPTAIICVNDFMAVGVLRELRERGIRVPQDVSVTGFDNIKLSEFCCPALTTVHIPRERIGHIAFESLVPEFRRSPLSGREIQIDPEFIIRESTGAAQESA